MKHADDETVTMMRARILKVLEIYPRLSPTMLHVGIGPQHKIGTWKPILDSLIKEGLVVQEDIVSLTSTDRHQSYRIISLAPKAEGV